MKNTLYQDLQDRNNLALYTLRLDGAHKLAYTGSPSEQLSQEEIAVLRETLFAYFEQVRGYLEEVCGFQLTHLVVSLDARGIHPTRVVRRQRGKRGK